MPQTAFTTLTALSNVIWHTPLHLPLHTALVAHPKGRGCGRGMKMGWQGKGLLRAPPRGPPRGKNGTPLWGNKDIGAAGKWGGASCTLSWMWSLLMGRHSRGGGIGEQCMLPFGKWVYVELLILCLYWLYYGLSGKTAPWLWGGGGGRLSAKC